MLRAFGWPVESAPGVARLTGGHRLEATAVAVPADFSSAAFFLVAASVVPGSDLLLRRVGMNPRRTGLVEVLRAMGGDIRVEAQSDAGANPSRTCACGTHHCTGSMCRSTSLPT
jgi:3-phosphoshikimate 1-carboxyvinyltransferase